MSVQRFYLCSFFFFFFMENKSVSWLSPEAVWEKGNGGRGQDVPVLVYRLSLNPAIASLYFRLSPIGNGLIQQSRLILIFLDNRTGGTMQQEQFAWLCRIEMGPQKSRYLLRRIPVTRDSQPCHCWYLGLDNSLLWEAAPSIAECGAASLASPRQMQAASFPQWEIISSHC